MTSHPDLPKSQMNIAANRWLVCLQDWVAFSWQTFSLKKKNIPSWSFFKINISISLGKSVFQLKIFHWKYFCKPSNTNGHKQPAPKRQTKQKTGMPQGKINLYIHLRASQYKVDGDYQKASPCLLRISAMSSLTYRDLSTAIRPGEEPHQRRHSEFEGKS